MRLKSYWGKYNSPTEYISFPTVLYAIADSIKLPLDGFEQDIFLIAQDNMRIIDFYKDFRMKYEDFYEDFLSFKLDGIPKDAWFPVHSGHTTKSLDYKIDSDLMLWRLFPENGVEITSDPAADEFWIKVTPEVDRAFRLEMAAWKLSQALHLSPHDRPTLLMYDILKHHLVQADSDTNWGKLLKELETAMNHGQRTYHHIQAVYHTASSYGISHFKKYVFQAPNDPEYFPTDDDTPVQDVFWLEYYGFKSDNLFEFLDERKIKYKKPYYENNKLEGDAGIAEFLKCTVRQVRYLREKQPALFRYEGRKVTALKSEIDHLIE